MLCLSPMQMARYPSIDCCAPPHTYATFGFGRKSKYEEGPTIAFGQLREKVVAFSVSSNLVTGAHFMPESTPVIPFIVVGGARSGTTLLKNLLRSHPNLLSFSEIFCPGRIYWDYPDMEHMDTPETVAWRDANPVEFMKAVYGSEHEERFAAVGFKLLYNQLFSPELKPLSRYLFSLEGLRVVHIRRENLFKAHVSRLIAAQRKARGMTLNAGTAAEVETDIHVRAEVVDCEAFFRLARGFEERTRAFLRKSLRWK